MAQQGIKHTINLADGRIIELETGKLATQADGSVVVKMGGTMLLATVVSNPKPLEGADFMPLTVDYREKYASTGRFPGGFLKRETRPSDYEVLISRLIDRALRPLFPSDYHSDTQVLVSLISSDKENMPDSLACLAASAAIAVSDVPFTSPVSEVRVARINGTLVINPVLSELEKADIDLIIAGTEKDIVMVEGEMKEVSEQDMISALKLAHDVIKLQCKAQSELGLKIGKKKREYSHETNDAELLEKVKTACYQKCYTTALAGTANKNARKEAFGNIKAEFIASIDAAYAEEKAALIDKYFHDVEKDAVRNAILEKKIRLDGRKLDEIRPIWSEIDYLPSTHGSAIFTRGETQSLTSVTLGTKLDEQSIDGAFITGSEKFILHYNFPPFSTGEAKPMRGTGRREVGHGNLALRALKPMIPTGQENPYTIRIVSDILESNGSSSMATVCAGTLALLDAGVKMKKPVSGIAMGLITDAKGNYAVLSDILGDEDHLGDMDFKVTGTKDGITACQMDIKIDGLSFEVLAEALEQAKKGRLHILNEMSKTISEPRTDYKPHAPRIVQLTIPKEFIGAVIGPGGKVIQEIQRETGAVIVIEEVGDKGVVDVSADNKAAIDAAVGRIKAITAQPEIGEIYTGKVKSIVPFGAFVEILPGKDGLLHISEIEWRRLETVDGVLKEGETIQVKLIDIDQKTGKFKLSRKVLLPKPEKQPQ
jgi:polyribonucleotide nucleotidyltransferase